MIERPDAGSIPSHWVDQRRAECASFEGGHAVRAVGEVLFATDEGSPPEDRIEWLACRVDQLRTRVRGRGMFVFALSLWLIYWLAPLWSFRFGSLGRLPLDQRARVLERWERGPFGMSLFGRLSRRAPGGPQALERRSGSVRRCSHDAADSSRGASRCPLRDSAFRHPDEPPLAA